MCDGKAIFEFNVPKKLLIERRIAPEMQGKAISDGPLPFVFGAKADQLKRRYWMHDVTPKEEIGKSVWLEAFPKYQADAANFQSASVILSEPDFLPQGLQIILPGAAPAPNKSTNAKEEQPLTANTAYLFTSPTVNGMFDRARLLAPSITPAMALKGWKHVVEEDPGDQPAEPAKTAAPAANDPSQAKRPAAPRRK